MSTTPQKKTEQCKRMVWYRRMYNGLQNGFAVEKQFAVEVHRLYFICTHQHVSCRTVFISLSLGTRGIFLKGQFLVYVSALQPSIAFHFPNYVHLLFSLDSSKPSSFLGCLVHAPWEEEMFNTRAWTKPEGIWIMRGATYTCRYYTKTKPASTRLCRAGDIWRADIEQFCFGKRDSALEGAQRILKRNPRCSMLPIVCRVSAATASSFSF